MSDIITIDTAEAVAGGKKWVYQDTYGKKWTSWADKIVLVAKHTYEIQEMKPNTWSPKGDPSKSFTDNVITKAREIPAHQAQHSPQTNGRAQPAQNGRQKWDKDEVLSARLSLIIGGWAQSGQIALDGQSVARALKALDNGLQIYNAQYPTSEDPGDGMEGTEFGR